MKVDGKVKVKVKKGIAEQIGGFDGGSRVVQVLPYPGTRGHPFLRGFFSSRKKGRGGP